MAHYEFHADLIDGEVGEREVVDFLATQHGGKFVFDNKTNSLDTLLNFPEKSVFGQGFLTFEIKTDVLVSPTRDTGNLFIEVQSRGKKSGIQVTQANWFLYYLKHLNELWAIKPQDLLALIRTGAFSTVEGGDHGSGTRGVLIPRERTRTHFLVFSGIQS